MWRGPWKTSTFTDKHAPEVGLYAPVRIYVHEDERDTTRIDYHKG